MRALLIFIAPFAVILAAFIFSPLFGPKPFDQALSDTLLHGAIALTMLPLGVFYTRHPTSQLPRYGRIVDLFLGIGGVTTLAAIMLLVKAEFLLGGAFILLSVLCLYIARKIWLRVSQRA